MDCHWITGSICRCKKSFKYANLPSINEERKLRQSEKNESHNLFVDPYSKRQRHLFLFLCDWTCCCHSIDMATKISFTVLKPRQNLGKLQTKTQFLLVPSTHCWVKHCAVACGGNKVAQVRMKILQLWGKMIDIVLLCKSTEKNIGTLKILHGFTAWTSIMNTKILQIEITGFVNILVHFFAHLLWAFFHVKVHSYTPAAEHLYSGWLFLSLQKIQKSQRF